MTQTTPGNRDLAPDVLRGFALLGILLVNLSFFSHDSFGGVAGSDVEGGGNQAATLIMVALFQGKFYLLFSFLFGYSSLYITKGEKAGRGRWVGRSIILIVLGILHFTFLWHGDILFLYGAFGLVLVAFMFRSDKALKVWAWVLWGFSALILTSLSLLTWLGEQTGFETPPVEDVELNEVMRSGSYLDSLMPRVELWTLGVTGGVLLQGGLVSAAFLVGLLAARKKLLTTGSDHLKLRTMLVWGLGLGLPLQVLAAWLYVANEVSPTGTESTYLGALTIGFMTAPLLSMAYLALTVIAIQKLPRVVSWLRYPGRMALTNYLAQSVALSLIFGPWGLGLFGQVDYWVAFVIAIGVFVVLSLGSLVWLRVFRQGPMEWLMGVVTRRPQRV
jgi:uncharacterized protein